MAEATIDNPFSARNVACFIRAQHKYRIRYVFWLPDSVLGDAGQEPVPRLVINVGIVIRLGQRCVYQARADCYTTDTVFGVIKGKLPAQTHHAVFRSRVFNAGVRQRSQTHQ